MIIDNLYQYKYLRVTQILKNYIFILWSNTPTDHIVVLCIIFSNP